MDELCEAARQTLRKNLGEYAFEDCMPEWQLASLDRGGRIQRHMMPQSNGRTSLVAENQVEGVIPILAELLRLDNSVHEAWLCHPAVDQIFGPDNEGPFCGFRNLQMLASAKLRTHTSGWEQCESKEVRRPVRNILLPSVIEMQQWIEDAWDFGFNSACRNEYGHVLGTRKWIGTPEIEAILQSREIPHRRETFSEEEDLATPPLTRLLRFTRSYFSTGRVLRPSRYNNAQGGAHSGFAQTRLTPIAKIDQAAVTRSLPRYGPSIPPRMPRGGRSQLSMDSYANIPLVLKQSRASRPSVVITSRAPIYLQMHGHSVTVVGIERRRDGSWNFLIFDPSFAAPRGIREIVQQPWKDGRMSSPWLLSEPAIHPPSIHNMFSQDFGTFTSTNAPAIHLAAHFLDRDNDVMMSGCSEVRYSSQDFRGGGHLVDRDGHSTRSMRRNSRSLLKTMDNPVRTYDGPRYVPPPRRAPLEFLNEYTIKGQSSCPDPQSWMTLEHAKDVDQTTLRRMIEPYRRTRCWDFSSMDNGLADSGVESSEEMYESREGFELKPLARVREDYMPDVDNWISMGNWGTAKLFDCIYVNLERDNETRHW